MRFRWTYYYEDLEQERKQQQQQQQHQHQHQHQPQLPASGVPAGHSKHDELAALAPLPSSQSTASDTIQRPLQPHIPYLVWPSYSGDVLAIDYHAAQHAASASNQAQLDDIARDEAEYAATQLRIATERSRQQAQALAAQRSKKRRTSSALASSSAVADHFESFSFAPEDLLPPHPPDSQSKSADPARIPHHRQESDIRNRAAAIVRLGAGGPALAPVTRWKPPPEPDHPRSFGFWPSSSYPIKYDPNIGSITMSQRMAALGVLYSTGAAAMSSTPGGHLPGLTARAPASAQTGLNADIWSLSPHTFSAWFPPPYRVLTLVALGILVFAADVAVLSRLGIDPVPLLFPAAATGGLARNRSSALASSPSSLPGLGQGLVTSRQLSTALFMLGAIYTLIALGGWASFRFYVDSIAGDPSGRHAQALQGLAVTLALGLACWPGRLLFRPIRIAFWVALGRLFWPEPVPAFIKIQQRQQRRRRGGGRSRRTPNGNGSVPGLEEGEEAEGELEAEMNLFHPSGAAQHHQADRDGDDEEEDEEHDADTNPMLSSTRQYPLLSRPNLQRNFHRLTRALQDTRRWFQPPSFSSVILADILTSFAKVFADVWLTACFLVPRKEHHTWWNGRGSVVVPVLTSLPYVIRFRQCVSEYLSTGPLSASAASGSGLLFSNKPVAPDPTAGPPTPAHLRGRRSRKPLWNALKYFSALPVIWLAALEGFASSELVAYQAGLESEGRVEVLGTGNGSGLTDGTRMVRRELLSWGEEAKWRQKMIWRCWLFWVFFNSIFSFWWDVTNDWGLDMFRLRTVSQIIQAGPSRTSSSSHLHPGGSHRRGISSVVLRPPTKALLFPEWAYHLSIVLDLILRFTWSIKLSSQLYRYADWEGGVFVFEALEILRRGAWVVLRFEHAALVGFASERGNGGGGGGHLAIGAGREGGVGNTSSLDRSVHANGPADTASYQDEEAESSVGSGLGSQKESRWGPGAAGATSSRATLHD